MVTIYFGDNEPRGQLTENFITENDICLMNDKSHSYRDVGKGTFSSIDLSLCHPSLFLDDDLSVCEDQQRSDHFSIITESKDHNSKWKLNKANWNLFHSLCKESLTPLSLFEYIDPIAGFIAFLIEICGKCIPKTSRSPKKSNQWHKKDREEAIKQRI